MNEEKFYYVRYNLMLDNFIVGYYKLNDNKPNEIRVFKNVDDTNKFTSKLQDDNYKLRI